MEALYCLPGSGYAAIRLSGLALRRVYIEGASEDAVLKEAMMAGGMLTDSQLERSIRFLSLTDDEVRMHDIGRFGTDVVYEVLLTSCILKNGISATCAFSTGIGNICIP